MAEQPQKEIVAQPGMSLSGLMTAREVAAYLGVTVLTVYRLINVHGLPARWDGKQWRFSAESIDAWIEGKPTDP